MPDETGRLATQGDDAVRENDRKIVESMEKHTRPRQEATFQSNRPAITHYEADHIGHVYAVYRDGSVWPTGVTLPGLAGMNEISKRVFRAELREGHRG